uniref:Uncharacterized protein n=1 Tax=Rhizophora mucronata TaxID=61149 RepID=A0A2P2PSL6_RHIMU
MELFAVLKEQQLASPALYSHNIYKQKINDIFAL